MVRVVYDKNLLIVYSKLFLYFEWKLEESDLKKDLQSSEFCIDGKNQSFLKIGFSAGVRYLILYNPKRLRYGYYMLNILDKDKSVICSHAGLKHVSKTAVFDLFEKFEGFSFETKYPITICCTVRSSNTALSKLYCVSYENRMDKMSSDLMKILDEAYNTDVVLNTGGENIKAHKIILQARSPVFQKMFDHDLIEAANNTVDVSDIGSATMRRLVNFLYACKMEECNFDEAMELYYAADKYEVLSLQEACKTELLSHLDVNNACSLFTFASRHSDEDFKNGVVKFISANFTSVINSEAFLEMSKEDMALLVRSTAPEVKN
ncbi:TD and POZ domain-containing protein 2 isoform X1 [Parasteatoda tepidariorum]|uniref:TD and POZ domain-containing protein 2 isoform X1 n=1 Tax=Parasteatoda tepidariorum TaxID=114398 RepID=UPI001C717EC3|nr:TD and POZ domain-containing protein 2-like [Parasteatoda tepidariorum]